MESGLGFWGLIGGKGNMDGQDGEAGGRCPGSRRGVAVVAGRNLAATKSTKEWQHWSLRDNGEEGRELDMDDVDKEV